MSTSTTHASHVSRAKINLTLHVGEVIADPQDLFYGYHPLDSLVAFSDLGDELSGVASDNLDLQITGAFAHELAGIEDNLIVKAYRAVARETELPPLAFSLVKNLPVAAGIGGGSANAAAALRLICAYTDIDPARLQRMALGLGADVPVCLLSQTAHMTGIGETVRSLQGLGQHAAVLVNPGVAVSTAAVFKAFDVAPIRRTPRPQKQSGSLLERVLDGRNDLESFAIAAAPVIESVLKVLREQSGCQLARMSGSGATCFGLFPSLTDARQVAENMKNTHTDWWVQAVMLGEAT